MLGLETFSAKKQLYRIERIALVLILTSLVYYFNDKSIYNYPMTLGDFFRRVYSYRLKYHLWFLYDYIAFLITIPFLSKIAKGLTRNLFIYLCAVVLALQAVIPIFEYVVFRNSITIYSHLRPSWMVESIVVFPLVGYYLYQEKRSIKAKELLLIWLINVRVGRNEPQSVGR